MPDLLKRERESERERKRIRERERDNCLHENDRRKNSNLRIVQLATINFESEMRNAEKIRSEESRSNTALPENVCKNENFE